MARGLAVGVWLLSTVAMYLVMVSGQRYKYRLESLGVAPSQSERALITVADLITNYWYIVAGVLLVCCLAIFGGKSAPKSHPGD